jgi:YHS domain-containing protein
MNIKTLACLILSSLIVSSCHSHRGHDHGKNESKPAAIEVTNGLCSVSGDEIDPAISVVFQGKKISFCCKRCKTKFNANPQKYQKSPEKEPHDQ